MVCHVPILHRLAVSIKCGERLLFIDLGQYLRQYRARPSILTQNRRSKGQAGAWRDWRSPNGNAKHQLGKRIGEGIDKIMV